MIEKTIRVTIDADQFEEFLTRQKIWNRRMSEAPGFVSVSVGQHIDRSDIVQIELRFQDAAD